MGSVSALRGRFFLIVEDDLRVALDLSDEIEAHGGYAVVAYTAKDALELMARLKCAAAIIDHSLGADACEVGRRLTSMRVPFVLHSSSEEVGDDWLEAPMVRKPAIMHHLLETVCDLL
jgi:DNA-binding response OmpR family regulator